MAAKREQRRIVANLDGLFPVGVLRDRQAKVNALPVPLLLAGREPHKGTMSAGGEISTVRIFAGE